MMKALCMSVFLAFVLPLNLAQSAEMVENKALDRLFASEGITGTIVIYDEKNDTYQVHDKERAQTEYPPASTFKIFHSLIALESGVIDDVDTVFYRYDGKPVYLDSWAQDASLRSAVKVSQVPAFQQLAAMIGEVKMQRGLDILNYGNKEIGSDITTFWLDGTLKISAKEQADLLYSLAKGRLKLSIKGQRQVCDIIMLENKGGAHLFGKTGLAELGNGKELGLFVGFAFIKGYVYAFAMNMDDKNKQNINKRIPLVQKALAIVAK